MAAAAVYLTIALSSLNFGANCGITLTSSLRASATTAAVRTIPLLWFSAPIKACLVFGSASVMSIFAAVACTAEASSLVNALTAPYPRPPNGTNPRPCWNPICAIFFGSLRVFFCEAVKDDPLFRSPVRIA